MTSADKTIIIQNLQCKHATWLDEFNSSLSLGKCVTKKHLDNVVITNLINVVYRYSPWDDTITNAFTVEYTYPSARIVTYPLTLDLTVGGITYSASANLGEDLLLDLQNEIIAGGVYYAYISDNILTVYSIDLGEVVELPTYVASDGIVDIVLLAISTFVPDLNCITEAELCEVVCKVKNLTIDCNC